MKILKVIRQGEPIAIAKQDGTQTQKCNILLQELGGKFENEYIAVMLGNMANLKFYEGDVVAAKLRFATHEHADQVYQQITVQEIVKLKN